MEFSRRVVLLLAVAWTCSAAGQARTGEPEAVIETGDVARFYAIYDAAGGKPTAEALQSYIDDGSDGLHALAEARDVSGVRIADAIASRPALYENARDCVAVLPAVTRRLRGVLARLFELYPHGRTPAVTIAVGRGKPVGVGSAERGVQIGLEALCAASFLHPDVELRFVHVIAHEYVHVQQRRSFEGPADGEAPTVLDVSLSEGIAEFIGELISGDVAYGALRGRVVGREREIGRAFLADKDLTELSKWVYNASPTEPGDLGYWVGYQIAKAYYDKAKDKRRAVAEMLELTDSNAFLDASGWMP